MRADDLALDLGDETLLNFRWLGEDQDEWLDAIQLLAPVLELLVTKLGAAIGGADEPVAEIGIMELDRWKMSTPWMESWKRS